MTFLDDFLSYFTIDDPSNSANRPSLAGISMFITQIVPEEGYLKTAQVRCGTCLALGMAPLSIQINKTVTLNLVIIHAKVQIEESVCCEKGPRDSIDACVSGRIVVPAIYYSA